MGRAIGKRGPQCIERGSGRPGFKIHAQDLPRHPVDVVETIRRCIRNSHAPRQQWPFTSWWPCLSLALPCQGAGHALSVDIFTELCLNVQ